MTNIISGTPIYSTSSTYAVGDRVRYSNNVWECITAITTAEAWKEAHWQEVAPLQEQIDDKQDAITSSNKLSSDLVSDVNSTNKFITSTERTTWNSKQSLLVSGTNIKTINNESILGSGNITIEGGGTVNTYYLVNILNMTSTSDATYEIVNDLINNNQFVIFDDPDGRSRELFCYVPIKTYYQSDLDIQTFWYIDNQDKYNLVVITHSGTSVTVIRTTYHSIEEAYNLADGKQNALVSGTNIKTINNQSILGSGNITIDANSIDVQINESSIVSNNVANILTEGVYGTRNKLLTKGYADTHYVLEETIDDNVGYMYISPNIKDNKDVDFSINVQSNLDPDASADMNFGVEYDENEGKGHGYFRLGLYDAGSIEIDNNGTKITKVITPTNDGDAVNKKYVDDAVSDIDLSGKTDATKTLAGYTSQVRNNGANIVLSNVSASDSAKNSGAMFASGNFSFFKNNVELISSNNDGKLRIYNVKDPENDGDAVNKKYVDDAVVSASPTDVQINGTSIVSNNVANISVTDGYNETDSPLVSLWDVTIDGSVPLGTDEDSININTTSGNYDGTSVLLVTSDTLESAVGDIESILTTLDTGSGV